MDYNSFCPILHEIKKPSIIIHPLNWVKTANENIILLLSVAFNLEHTYYKVILIYIITQSEDQKEVPEKLILLIILPGVFFFEKVLENISYSAYINDIRIYFKNKIQTNYHF